MYLQLVVKLNAIKTKMEYIGATLLYIHRRKACIRRPLLLPDTEMYDFVRDGLDKFGSPEIISAKWKQTGSKGLSYTTIYNTLKNKLLAGQNTSSSSWET